MNRKVPKVFLYLIVNWYINCTAVVKWDNFISQSFHIQAGVRQGGVLSPCLFAIYINDIVVRLRDSRLGCFIADCFIGCILHADDILLVLSSITMLQRMLDICWHELSAYS